MSAVTYSATPYLRRLTAANGWRGQLIRDHHGRADVIVAVRVGPTFTDAVAIESEQRCVAMRYRTNEDALIVPHRGARHRGRVVVPRRAVSTCWRSCSSCKRSARNEGVPAPLSARTARYR